MSNTHLQENQHSVNLRKHTEPVGSKKHPNTMAISKDIRKDGTIRRVPAAGRKVRDPQFEAILKKSLGNLIRSELKEEFNKKGNSQLIFPHSGKRFLCKYSSFKSDQSRWFWGVSKKYWANWDSQDHLALIMENEDRQRFSYLLLDSQESGELFKKCSESKGEKKINMRIYVTGGGVRLQEWQELDIKTRIKPLPVNFG